MPAHELTFIPVVPSGRSRRAQKLVSSQIKSQASYVGYRNQKSRKDPEQYSSDEANANVFDTVDVAGDLHGRLLVEEDSDAYAANHSTWDHKHGSLVTKSNKRIAGKTMVHNRVDSLQLSLFHPELTFQYDPCPGLRVNPFLSIPTTSNLTDLAFIDFFAHDLGPINESVSWVFDMTNMVSGMMEMLFQKYSITPCCAPCGAWTTNCRN
jgi:hypothetical protein